VRAAAAWHSFRPVHWIDMGTTELSDKSVSKGGSYGELEYWSLQRLLFSSHVVLSVPMLNRIIMVGRHNSPRSFTRTRSARCSSRR
jgi:hypothetical protein